MPTRLAYRQRFATEMGGYGPLVGQTLLASTTSPNNTTVVMSRWPTHSTIEKDSLYEGWWLLRPQAGDVGDLVRQIPRGGYDPATGTFTVDLPYTYPMPDTEPFELHGHDVEPWWELANLVDAALRMIYVPVQVPIKFPADFLSPNSNHLINLTNGWSDGSVHGAIPALQQTGQVKRLDLLPTDGVEVQHIVLSGVPTQGTFTFTYRGISSPQSLCTASQATIQSNARLVPGLEGVVVTGTANPAATLDLTLYGAPLQVSSYVGFTGNALQTAGFVPVTATVSLSNPVGIAKPLKATLRQLGAEVLAELDHPLLSTDRLYVTFLARAYDWCRVNPVRAWGSQVGLSGGDLYEAIPSEEWVSAAMQVLYWARQPRVMVEATETRRAQAQADAQQVFDSYQDMHLRASTRSPLLTYEVDGGPLDRPLPIAIGGVTPARRGLPPGGAAQVAPPPAPSSAPPSAAAANGR